MDEPHDDYAIGNADRIAVIRATNGIRPIEYDLKQVQDEGYARYNASLYGSGEDTRPTTYLWGRGCPSPSQNTFGHTWRERYRDGSSPTTCSACS